MVYDLGLSQGRRFRFWVYGLDGLGRSVVLEVFGA